MHSILHTQPYGTLRRGTFTRPRDRQSCAFGDTIVDSQDCCQSSIAPSRPPISIAV